MGEAHGYFAAPGKSLSTARGNISADSDQPEITPACLVRGEATDEQLAAAKRSLEYLHDKGILVRQAKRPTAGVGLDPLHARADMDMRGKRAVEPAGGKATASKGKRSSKGG